MLARRKKQIVYGCTGALAAFILGPLILIAWVDHDIDEYYKSREEYETNKEAYQNLDLIQFRGQNLAYDQLFSSAYRAVADP